MDNVDLLGYAVFNHLFMKVLLLLTLRRSHNNHALFLILERESKVETKFMIILFANYF